MNEKFPQLFLGMLALAIAIVYATSLFGSSFVKAKQINETLTVTGSAKKQITSDYVVWRGSISRKSSDMAAAYSAVKVDTERVKEFFEDNDIPDSLVEFDPVSSSQKSTRDKQADGSEVTHWYWVMTQSFEVRSNDVERITELSREITDLIEEGVALQSYSPQYYYTKIAEMRVEMLGLATKDSRKRAETMVENAGGKLGSLVGARMGVFQITQPNSTEVSDYGIYDTSSIEKDITAVVKLTFAVE
ncbi:SIMPL domain-containing protein [bacterium]|nr:SIMPL domain-containing protein [bacterium]